VTRDIRTATGASLYPLEALDREPGVSWEFIGADARELLPRHIAGYDAVIIYSARVTRATLESVAPPLLFARLGVGLDDVDTEACTAAGVLVTITPDGVRRPMAAAAMAFLLGLSHSIVQKNNIVRSGRWDRFAYIGKGLSGRTLGILGFGNVGRDLCSLAEPFGLRRIASDPYAQPNNDVAWVDLETLLRESDFLCITCPLTEQTRHLLDASRLALMKPGAYLINVARGPIVDQQALTAALAEGRLAGAALDVFEQEPVDGGDPLLSLDNVILAPHSIGMTDEMLAEGGRSACESVLAVMQGRVPRYTANSEALNHPRLAGRFRR
jgi:D-3-phosphoglycerate dehydrogenase